MSEPDERSYDWTPTTIRLLERFYRKNGRSIATSIAINEDIVYLPLERITIEFTGEIDSDQKVINVTMPKWLAVQKRLA